MQLAAAAAPPIAAAAAAVDCRERMQSFLLHLLHMIMHWRSPAAAAATATAAAAAMAAAAVMAAAAAVRETTPAALVEPVEAQLLQNKKPHALL